MITRPFHRSCRRSRRHWFRSAFRAELHPRPSLKERRASSGPRAPAPGRGKPPAFHQSISAWSGGSPSRKPERPDSVLRVRHSGCKSEPPRCAISARAPFGEASAPIRRPYDLVLRSAAPQSRCPARHPPAPVPSAKPSTPRPPAPAQDGESILQRRQRSGGIRLDGKPSRAANRSARRMRSASLQKRRPRPPPRDHLFPDVPPPPEGRITLALAQGVGVDGEGPGGAVPSRLPVYRTPQGGGGPCTPVQA